MVQIQTAPLALPALVHSSASPIRSSLCHCLAHQWTLHRVSLHVSYRIQEIFVKNIDKLYLYVVFYKTKRRRLKNEFKLQNYLEQKNFIIFHTFQLVFSENFSLSKMVIFVNGALKPEILENNFLIQRRSCASQTSEEHAKKALNRQTKWNKEKRYFWKYSLRKKYNINFETSSITTAWNFNNTSRQ